VKSFIVYGLVAVVAVALVGVLAIYQMRGRIGPEDALFNGRITALQGAPSPGAEGPENLKVLTWNIHYGVGPKDDLHDRRSPEEVRAVLERIAAAIRQADPDIVLLQEVDFEADRSGGLDQLAFLQDRTKLPFSASIVTWNPRYVPFPYQDPKNWIGQVTSGQAVLSRFPLQQNRRRVLPQPAKNPFWYNWFYLHRSIQQVAVQISETRWIQVYNLHLEAFDGQNRQDQSRQVVEHVRGSLRPGEAMILGGDLNALPPEAPAHQAFLDEPELDYRFDDTIAHLRRELALTEAGGSHPSAQLTFPALKPNRRLDYLYASTTWELTAGGVVAQEDPPSDHLPVHMVLTTRGSERTKSPDDVGSQAPAEAALVPSSQIKAPSPVLPERLTGPVPVQGRPPRLGP
tara:strand:- start:61 stop:1263 length:1203 start_codon:yes stop_codon:yes gene_type:complete